MFSFAAIVAAALTGCVAQHGAGVRSRDIPPDAFGSFAGYPQLQEGSNAPLLPSSLVASGTFLPCAFTLSAIHYNLCPLLSGPEPLTITSHESTPPTHTDYTYTIGRSAPLQRDRTLPDELQCGEGTWVCLQVINSRPSHPSEPPRVLQVVPIAVAPDLRPTARRVDGKNALRIAVHGGIYNNKPQKAVFDFVCAEETTEPSLSWTFNGTHAFQWRSDHACGKAIEQPEPGDEEGGKMPAGDGEGEGDGTSPPTDPEEGERPDGDVREPSSGPTIPLAVWLVLGLGVLYFALRTLPPRIRSALLRRKARRTTGMYPAHGLGGIVPAQFMPASFLSAMRGKARYEPLFDAEETYDAGEDTYDAGEDTYNTGDNSYNTGEDSYDAEAGADVSGLEGGARDTGLDRRYASFENEASPLSATFGGRGAYGAAGGGK
ncbi:hypothetical protein BD626DRAFT_522398 [Schizophyllum amplum]|uniref:Autophagy-related protein 27 n=1 Tax=Schizophyllum amplum TaxID=97359 RepID=A0A550BTC6_9AGAR|nr:hypothetical protein BD626DRAFT_522398 [Auriculariopsis ampla]